MNALASLIREFDIWYLRWALREINPTHPDVPRIVMRLRHRLDQRQQCGSFIQSAWRWL